MTAPTLTLIRGISGSGKSTLAKELTSEGQAVHFENDMFFIDDNNEYVFQEELIADSHAWCQREVLSALQNDIDVVVSNVFSARYEVLPYHTIARLAGAHVRILICQNDFGNIHFVPTAVLDRQRNNWEDYVGEKQMQY